MLDDRELEFLQKVGRFFAFRTLVGRNMAALLRGISVLLTSVLRNY